MKLKYGFQLFVIYIVNMMIPDIKMLDIYFFLFACMSLASARQYARVCYYTNWSQYRIQPMSYKIEDVDPSLCTHIIFAFAQINGADHTLQKIEWNDIEAYGQLSQMKKVNLLIYSFTVFLSNNFKPTYSIHKNLK